MKRLVPIAALLLVASVAHAEPDSDPDPDRATALSSVGTIGSIALVAAGVFAATHSDPHDLATPALLLGTAGLMVGPALGHIYGEDRTWTPGFATRTAGLGVVLAGLAVELVRDPICIDAGTDCHHDHTGLAVAGVGAAVMVAGAVYDIVTAARATRAHHRR